MLIHGFSLVNARLLKAFGTAFYAITIVGKRGKRAISVRAIEVLLYSYIETNFPNHAFKLAP